jgi:N-acetyl-gamma-glutamyl-phosphate reductase
MLDAAIIGASGYGGGELLRWLSGHPHAQVAVATSSTYAGKPVHASFPGLANRLDLTFTGGDDLEAVSRCPIVFLARDNGVAMGIAPRLLEAGCRVIDLSADFRFRDPADHAPWYGGVHESPELCAEAVYGLPELHREEIRNARLVGNPGCYATASILALAPLLARKVARPESLIVDGKSGISGAGRSKFGLDYHYSEANESVSAYKVGGAHRHIGEIEQELGLVASAPVRTAFTPHLVPMTRGILVTCYADLIKEATADDLRQLYRERYAGEPFVHVSDGQPATKHTVGSNACHIGVAVDQRTNRAVITAAIDNLGKGMASQAVQNMNLMFGFEETAGLNAPGLWP